MYIYIYICPRMTPEFRAARIRCDERVPRGAEFGNGRDNGARSEAST